MSGWKHTEKLMLIEWTEPAQAPLCGQENGALMQPKPVYGKMLILSMVSLENSSFLLGFLKDHSSFHCMENVLFGSAGAAGFQPFLPGLRPRGEGGSDAFPDHCWQQETPSALQLHPLSEITQTGGKTPFSA